MDYSNLADTNLRPSDTTLKEDNVEHDGAGDILRHGILGDTNLTQEETKVIYHIDEEETPYKVTVRFFSDSSRIFRYTHLNWFLHFLYFFIL